MPTVLSWQYNGVAPWDDIVSWCMDNLYHGGHYEPNWYTNCYDTIYFTDPREYTFFAEVDMTKRIKLHEINKFVRFHKLFYQHFGARVLGPEAADQDQLRQIRTEALEFLRSNGFNVDDKMEWISWSDPKDYTMTLLKWA